MRIYLCTYTSFKTSYDLCQNDNQLLFLTSPPFIPLQGESLQDEPLSLNKERGLGGEVERMRNHLSQKESLERIDVLYLIKNMTTKLDKNQ